jgi:type II secretory pathway component PulF
MRDSVLPITGFPRRHEPRRAEPSLKEVSGALRKTGVVPPVYVQILRRGETTGKLPDLATCAANRLEEKVIDQVEKAQAAGVPIATCVVIAVVAVMLVGLYGPMTGLHQVLLR